MTRAVMRSVLLVAALFGWAADIEAQPNLAGRWEGAIKAGVPLNLEIPIAPRPFVAYVIDSFEVISSTGSVDPRQLELPMENAAVRFRDVK